MTVGSKTCISSVRVQAGMPASETHDNGRFPGLQLYLSGVLQHSQTFVVSACLPFYLSPSC